MQKLYQPAELCQEVKKGNLVGERVIVVFRIQPIAVSEDVYEYRPGYPTGSIPATIRMTFAVPISTSRIEKVSGMVTGITGGVVQMGNCNAD